MLFPSTKEITSCKKNQNRYLKLNEFCLAIKQAAKEQKEAVRKNRLGLSSILDEPTKYFCNHNINIFFDFQ